MPFAHRYTFLSLCTASLFSLTLIAGCGKSSTSATNPYGGGGGGGGGGTTFDFTFTSATESHSFTFANAGTVNYHCAVHAGSGMTGVVVVDAASVVDSALVSVGLNGSSTPALSFNPASVTIKPGGVVRWVRPASVSMSNHTVTAP